MLKRNTLFVIGAGASNDFGFPLSTDLILQLGETLKMESNYHGSGSQIIQQALVSHAMSNGGNNHINDYMTGARDIADASAQSPSIDTFLDLHQSNEYIVTAGKMGIVQSILQAEANSSLKYIEQGDFAPARNSWLIKLEHILYGGVSREEVEYAFDNASFISFNYDRILEYWMPRGMANFFKIPLEEAEEICSRQLKVFHPYGQLGPLPWQTGKPLPFGGNYNFSTILENFKNIRTFSERNEDVAFTTRMQKAIINADFIVFLGFGFHEVNMKLLEIPPSDKLRQSFATSIGCSPRHKSRHVAMLEKYLNIPPTYAEMFDMKAGGLLNELQYDLAC